jgi:hypothetical protein
MAELSITCPVTTAITEGGASVDVRRRVLIRTSGNFAANTAVDVNSPGTGWVAFGDTVTFSGATDFVENTQIFRGGKIQLTGENASSDNDVYFVAPSGSIAFEYHLVENDLIQIWQFVGSGTP